MHRDRDTDSVFKRNGRGTARAYLVVSSATPTGSESKEEPLMFLEGATLLDTDPRSE